MRNFFTVWGSRHLQVLFDTLGRLCKAPVSSGMTILVLAIAITLPLVMFKIVSSMESITSSWTGEPQISVFLKLDSVEHGLDPVEFGQRLLQNPTIEDVQYISPEQGIMEFAEMPGFNEAIKALPSNPLPPLLVVFPATGQDNTATDELVDQLAQMQEVDAAVYDQEWLYRLSAMIALIQRGVLVLALLMGISILLVISNTIRLGITNRAQEIEIINLVGGTHGFISRPFLYIGAIQCFLGGVLAWSLTNLTLFLLAKPVEQLAALYQSEFQVGWIGPGLAGGVILGAVLLGLIAARLTVNRFLQGLKPR